MVLTQYVEHEVKEGYSQAEIDAELDAIWQAMQNCLARGTRIGGVLPGGLKVARRAPLMMQELLSRQLGSSRRLAVRRCRGKGSTAPSNSVPTR